MKTENFPAYESGYSGPWRNVIERGLLYQSNYGKERANNWKGSNTLYNGKPVTSKRQLNAERRKFRKVITGDMIKASEVITDNSAFHALDAQRDSERNGRRF